MEKVNKQKVFLSGGFKSNWQQAVTNRLEDKFIFFNPRNHNLDSSVEYTVWDIHFVKQSDIVFAYLEKDNPSGIGLIFEIGIALGLGKTIILVDEKSSHDEIFTKYFKIVQNASSTLFTSFEEGIKYLESFSRF